MSYCRFSSDDYQCDVYVYEDVSGCWMTHVASRRYVFLEPLPPKVDYYGDPDEWMRRHLAVMDMVDKAKLVRIELDGVGGSHSDSTPGACAERLQALRGAGFAVPLYAIEALREEEAGG